VILLKHFAMRISLARAVLVSIIVVFAACATVPMRTTYGHLIKLPRQVAEGLESVPASDPAYDAADPTAATGAPGVGKVTQPYVVRLTRDMPVYRLWSGPAVKDPEGHTTRMGEWWTFDRPTGTRASYRERYEVCEKWNTLRFVAQCTLRRGAVVVIGLGQSVNDETCGEPGGREHYLANARAFQVYIHAAWTHSGTPNAMLSCPDESQDYRNDPNDVSKRY
jgi:hypothetical protein